MENFKLSFVPRSVSSENITFSDPESDTPSLVSTYVERGSSFRNEDTSTVTSNDTHFFSSSFTSEDDLTSYSPITKTKFDALSLENNLSAVITYLESASSANHEDPLRAYELEEPELNDERGTFVFSHSEDSDFVCDLRNSSFLK